MSALNAKMTPPGLDVWYDDQFRQVLEDHMTFLRNHPDNTYKSVEPMETIRYRFDLFGLFRAKGIEEYVHWVVMRMNGLSTSTDVTEKLVGFIVPSNTVVGQILQHYQTRNTRRP